MPVARVKDVDGRRVFLNTINYSKAKASTIGSFTAEVNGVYPFRVRFKNIGVSIPPSQGIGVAVIGSSFIIL
jgi:hypothetical protein